MINADILNKFKPITDEERAIQNGTLKYDVDHSIYLDSSRSVIDAKKLLEEGKLITVRPHARFFHSREHTHNYIEVVYMCSGTTTHFIDGKKIELKQGEMLFIKPNQPHFAESGNKEPNLFIISFSCRSESMNFFADKKLTVPENYRYLLQDIMLDYGAIEEKVPYSKLIYNEK